MDISKQGADKEFVLKRFLALSSVDYVPTIGIIAPRGCTVGDFDSFVSEQHAI